MFSLMMIDPHRRAKDASCNPWGLSCPHRPKKTAWGQSKEESRQGLYIAGVGWPSLVGRGL